MWFLGTTRLLSTWSWAFLGVPGKIRNDMVKACFRGSYTLLSAGGELLCSTLWLTAYCLNEGIQAHFLVRAVARDCQLTPQSDGIEHTVILNRMGPICSEPYYLNIEA